MTKKQRVSVIRRRNAGISFTKIAEATGVSKNTISGFYRRNKGGENNG